MPAPVRFTAKVGGEQRRPAEGRDGARSWPGDDLPPGAQLGPGLRHRLCAAGLLPVVEHRIAHGLEQYQEGREIRPRARYAGEVPA